MQIQFFIKMFIVIACMIVGIAVGYLLRNRNINLILRFTITFIWLLLFLLGLEIGSNNNIISQLGSLGMEAFLIASAATLGSIVAAKLLWRIIIKKKKDK